MISLSLNVDIAAAKRGTPVDIFPDKILGLVDMPMSGTVLIMNGGATLAVREGKEQILAKIELYNNSQTSTIKQGE